MFFGVVFSVHLAVEKNKPPFDTFIGLKGEGMHYDLHSFLWKSDRNDCFEKKFTRGLFSTTLPR